MVEEEEGRSKDPMWIKRRQEAAETKKRAEEAAVEAKINPFTTITSFSKSENASRFHSFQENYVVF